MIPDAISKTPWKPMAGLVLAASEYFMMAVETPDSSNCVPLHPPKSAVNDYCGYFDWRKTKCPLLGPFLRLDYSVRNLDLGLLERPFHSECFMPNTEFTHGPLDPLVSLR